MIYNQIVTWTAFAILAMFKIDCLAVKFFSTIPAMDAEVCVVAMKIRTF